jgi:RNA polymerase sigma-70 factor (ECF subfamily)
MKRYEKKLFAYIMRISSFSPEEAEDTLQDVFIKVYKNLRDFDLELKFSSWIYRITHNEVISKYRKNSARPKLLSEEASTIILQRISDDFNLETDLDRDFLRKNIYKVLSRIEKKYKEVLILKYFEEKEYKEISDILKKPIGSVATLLYRAKEKLRAEISREKNNFIYE